MSADATTLKSGIHLYPQPIALSCGRILRAKTPQERLDAVLKAAEVLTRYLAALTISSFAARDDDTDPTRPPAALEALQGNLSFGQFLSVVQGIASLNVEHPLRRPLQQAFKDPGIANAHLVSLLNLRNNIGHALAGLTSIRAQLHFRDDQPEEKLVETLVSVRPLLQSPLLLVEEQHFEEQRFIAHRLRLMGESADPLPDEVELSTGLRSTRKLYVGIRGGVLRLYPLLLWDMVEAHANSGVYFLHRTKPQALEYITVGNDETTVIGDAPHAFGQILAGQRERTEVVALSRGGDFFSEWLDQIKLIEQIQGLAGGVVPWQDCDDTTVRWYAEKLESGSGAALEQAREAIARRLLDGREVLDNDELRQFRLLFGTREVVGRLLKRTLLDCRARKDPETRWDERLELTDNVIICLRRAVDFFSRHVGVGGVTIDGLQATSGQADYIAMREALVNLFLHQDYADARTAGQIEIRVNDVLFHNAGKSLVPLKGVYEGSTSQSRNPLISRALRLIGFAELAGSGLREVQRAWRNARRRPPQIDSQPSANTFSLTLDWREIPVIADSFWQKRLGLTISSQEALALQLSADLAGISPEQISSTLGCTVDEGNALAATLLRQSVVDKKGNRLFIKSHLRSLVDEATTAASDSAAELE